VTTDAAILFGMLLDSPPLINGNGNGGGGYTDETLTFTGDLITDAVRTAGVEGDGLTPPAGVGIWPAATNLVTNGGFETNTTGWTATGGSFARDTTRQFFGVASGRMTVLTDSDSVASAALTVSSAAVYTAQTRLLIPVGKDVLFRILESTGTTPLGSVTVSGTGAWQQATVTGTSTDTGIVVQVIDDANAGGGYNLWMDGIQLESGSIATPYIETDGGTASRLAGTVQQPVADLFTATQGAAFARIVTGFANTNTAVVGSRVMLFGDSDATSQQIILNTGAPGSISVNRRNNDGAASHVIGTPTYAAGDSLSVLSAWTATTIGGALNGAAITTAANTSIPTYAATTLYIGSRLADGVRQLNGRVLWWATFAGTLTNADSATLNAFGDTPPTWAQIKGALPATAELTSLWPAVDTTYQKAA